MYLAWNDKCDVYMMSTCIADDVTNVTRKGQDEQVPEIIQTFNSKMGCIDKSNQMFTSYLQIREKKTQKMLYKVIFYIF